MRSIAAANVDGVATAGIFVWNSDGNDNVGTGSCPLTDNAGQSPYALAAVSTVTVSGCRLYSNPSVGWHQGLTLRTDLFYQGWGPIYYYDSTTSGYALASAFGSH